MKYKELKDIILSDLDAIGGVIFYTDYCLRLHSK